MSPHAACRTPKAATWGATIAGAVAATWRDLRGADAPFDSIHGKARCRGSTCPCAGRGAPAALPRAVGVGAYWRRSRNLGRGHGTYSVGGPAAPWRSHRGTLRAQ